MTNEQLAVLLLNIRQNINITSARLGVELEKRGFSEEEIAILCSGIDGIVDALSRQTQALAGIEC